MPSVCLKSFLAASCFGSLGLAANRTSVSMTGMSLQPLIGPWLIAAFIVRLSDNPRKNFVGVFRKRLYYDPFAFGPN